MTQQAGICRGEFTAALMTWLRGFSESPCQGDQVCGIRKSARERQCRGRNGNMRCSRQRSRNTVRDASKSLRQTYHRPRLRRDRAWPRHRKADRGGAWRNGQCREHPRSRGNVQLHHTALRALVGLIFRKNRLSSNVPPHGQQFYPAFRRADNGLCKRHPALW